MKTTMLKSKILITALASGAAMLAMQAQAENQTVTSTSQNVTVNGVTFTANDGNVTGENNPPTAAPAVTGTRPYTSAGDTGSLEIHGDRSRYVIGNLFGNLNSTGFAFSDLQSFTFAWNAQATTASQIYAAPVARVIIADQSGARTELIWEYVYNGGSPSAQTPLNTWFNADSTSVWYANVRGPTDGNRNTPLSVFKQNSQSNTANFGILGANGNGQGVLGNSGSQINLQLADWIPYFSTQARVIALSFGVGSSAGNGFTGFVDNVNIATNVNDTINFELPQQSAVPEPATWGMMIAGFGMMGGAMRTRRRRTKVSFA